MTGVRSLFLVKTPNGHLGTKRFNHKDGPHSHDDRPFTSARVFTRCRDANDALGPKGWHVVEVTLSL